MAHQQPPPVSWTWEPFVRLPCKGTDSASITPSHNMCDDAAVLLDTPVSDAVMNAVWDRCSQRMACDGAALRVIGGGSYHSPTSQTLPTHIIGDMDTLQRSLDIDPVDMHEWVEKTCGSATSCHWDKSQEENDCVKALTYLRTHATWYSATRTLVHLIGGISTTRLDHTIGNILALQAVPGRAMLWYSNGITMLLRTSE